MAKGKKSNKELISEYSRYIETSWSDIVINDENDDVRYFVARANYVIPSWHPASKHGHDYLFVGIIAPNGQVIPLSSVGKNLADTAEDLPVWKQILPFGTRNSFLKSEAFPYDLKKQLWRSSGNTHDISYKAYEVNKSDFDTVLQSITDLKNTKDQEPDDHTTRYQYIKTHKPKASNNNATITYTSTQFETLVAINQACTENAISKLQAIEASSDDTDKDLKEPSIQLLVLLNTLTQDKPYNSFSTEEYRIFHFIAAHFLLIKQFEENPKEYYQFDLQYIKQTILAAYKTLFDWLKEKLGTLQDNEDAKGFLETISTLEARLKDKNTTASELFDSANAAVDSLLDLKKSLKEQYKNHIHAKNCLPVVGSHDCFQKTPAINPDYNELHMIKKDCQVWGTVHLNAALPEFDDSNYTNQRWVKHQRTFQHTDGEILHPELFTLSPRPYKPTKPIKTLRFHYRALQLIYKHLENRNNFSEAERGQYEDWLAKYNHLVNYLLNPEADFSNIKNITRLFDLLQNRPMEPQALNKQLEKLTLEEAQQHQYMVNYTKLQGLVVTDNNKKNKQQFDIFMTSAKNLYATEPDKIDLINGVFEDMTQAIESSQQNKNPSPVLNEATMKNLEAKYNRIKHNTPLWNHFLTSALLLTGAVLVGIAAATAVVAPVSIACLIVGSGLFATGTMRATNTIYQTGNLLTRHKESTFINKVEPLLKLAAN